MTAEIEDDAEALMIAVLLGAYYCTAKAAALSSAKLPLNSINSIYFDP